MRRWKLRYLIAVVGALAFLALGPRLLIDALTSATERPDGPVAQVSTLRFTPVADTYVNEAHPHTSYGDRLDFDVDGKPVKEAYLMFDLSGIDGLVTSAKLRLLVTNASPHSGGSIRQVSDTTWSETEMTFKKRPMIDGPVLSTLGPVEKGQVVTFDVTRAELRNGLVSFAMTSHRQDGVEYASRESPNSPELVITVTSGGSGITTVRSTSPSGDPVLVGAGDIASCRSKGARETARLIASIPGTVFTAGDHAYPDGTARQFAECYGPTWGALQRTDPPGAGQPRLPDRRRTGVLRVLRRECRPAGSRLLLLQPWDVAHLGDRLEHRGRQGVTPVRLASAGTDRESGHLHAGHLAPPAL